MKFDHIYPFVEQIRYDTNMEQKYISYYTKFQNFLYRFFELCYSLKQSHVKIHIYGLKICNSLSAEYGNLIHYSYAKREVIMPDGIDGDSKHSEE